MGMEDKKAKRLTCPCFAFDNLGYERRWCTSQTMAPANTRERAARQRTSREYSYESEFPVHCTTSSRKTFG
jgi:hypothetical protein